MNLPTVIRLMQQRIPVLRTKELFHDSGDGQRSEAWGLWDSSAQTITMCKGQGPDRERTTFVHENLHAMITFGGMAQVSGEEDMVTRLAPILLSWLRENPRTVAYLMERA